MNPSRLGQLGKASFALLWAALILRYVYAVLVPMTNDEAYYWDWGRQLQLSYFDHPPGVAWLTHVSSWLAPGGPLAVRLLSPLCHLIATAGLLAALPLAAQVVTPCSPGVAKPSSLAPRTSRLQSMPAAFFLIALTAVMPGLSIWGVVALPDTGLLAALSWALVLALRYGMRSESAKPLQWYEGLLLGLVLGLAGNFKYHTLLSGGGMLAALLWVRRRSLSRELGFWLVLLLSGLAATMPVWLWNLQNDFASIRFQSDHGFGGLRLKPLFAARAWLGQMVLVSPAVFFAGLALLWRLRSRPSPGAWVIAGAFVPLFVVVELVAPFKQTLPHWVLPAFWLVLPFVAVDAAAGLAEGRKLGWWRGNLVTCGVLTFVLPWVVASSYLRERLLDSTEGNPGPLSELTLWPHLAATLEKDPRWTGDDVLKKLLKEAPPHCVDKPYRASLRWFWTAQLAFHLPDQPRVLELDETRASYYHFRDAALPISGCPVVIAGDRKHFNAERLDRRVTNYTVEPLQVTGHEKMAFVLIRGTLR